MPEPIDITVCALYHCTIEALIHLQTCAIYVTCGPFGKVVILKAYRACYICPGLVFQCKFNGDVRLVIRLT